MLSADFIGILEVMNFNYLKKLKSKLNYKIKNILLYCIFMVKNSVYGLLEMVSFNNVTHALVSGSDIQCMSMQ